MAKSGIFLSGAALGVCVFLLPQACSFLVQKRLDAADTITERETASPSGRYQLVVRDFSGPLTADHRSEVSIISRASTGNSVIRSVMILGCVLNRVSWVNDHRILIEVPDTYFSQLSTAVCMDENNLRKEENVYIDVSITHGTR